MKQQGKAYKALVIFLSLLALAILCVNGILFLKLYRVKHSPQVTAPSASEAEVSPAPDATPEALPEATPAPTATPDPLLIFCTPRVEYTSCWEDPGCTLQIDTLVKTGSGPVRILSEENGMCHARLSDGTEVWLNSWQLVASDSAQQEERDAALLNFYSRYDGFTWYEGENATRTVTCSMLNCRSGPSAAYHAVYGIPYGTIVTVIAQCMNYSLCALPEGGFLWCCSDYLTSDTNYLHVFGAVDLREYLPEAQFDLRFASANNIIGRSLYPAVPLLEESTARMLQRAYQRFLADGYILKICDAYRPVSAQVTLFNAVRSSSYIANPATGYSYHQYGLAVDITLVDAETGEELEMPTDMHTFSREAQRRNSGDWSYAAQQNVNYLTSVMQSCGFGIIATEWWHFQNDSGSDYRLEPAMDLSQLCYIAEGEG